MAYCEQHNNWELGWTWADRGVLFEIDHIKALGLYNLADPAEVALAAHYTNLQPLSVSAHKVKSVQDAALIRAKFNNDGYG
jgi:hypothetical protein